MHGDQRQLVAALRQLSDVALLQASRDELIEALAGSARTLLGVDQVHVIEVSQDEAVGHGRVTAFDATAARDDSYVQVMDDRPSGTAHVIATGEALRVPDARSGRLRRDYVERFNVASACFVPLRWDDGVRHVLVLVSHTPRDFPDEEVELAQLLANTAAGGLALLEERAQQDARDEADAALARAARALNVPQDLPEVLEVLAREAAIAVGGDMSGFYLGDAESGGVATAGHNSPQGWLGYVMQPGEGVAGLVLASGRSAIANAYQSDVRLPENLGLRRLQTGVAVPLSWEGKLLGALSVGFIHMRRVRDADLRTLQAIADLAAVACRSAQSG